MHVVILGGTGFIGSALTRALLARGDAVTVSSRAPRAPGVSGTGDAGGAQGFSTATWNGRDPEPLIRLLEDAHAVVNLVGENIAGGRWTPERKARIVDSRVAAGQAVAAALGAMNGAGLPAVLVQASAVGYYGCWPDMAAAPRCGEGDPPGAGFLAETCARWEASSAPSSAAGWCWGRAARWRACCPRSGPGWAARWAAADSLFRGFT